MKGYTISLFAADGALISGHVPPPHLKRHAAIRNALDSTANPDQVFKAVVVNGRGRGSIFRIGPKGGIIRDNVA